MNRIPLHELVPVLSVFFCLSQVALIGSILAFIHDMHLALAAVRVKIRR